MESTVQYLQDPNVVYVFKLQYLQDPNVVFVFKVQYLQNPNVVYAFKLQHLQDPNVQKFKHHNTPNVSLHIAKSSKPLCQISIP